MQTALELHQEAGDEVGVAGCLSHLAAAEAWLGHADRAAELDERALQAAPRAALEAALAHISSQSAIVAPQFEENARLARVAVALVQRVGDLLEVARLCSMTAYRAIAERRDHAALAWLTEGIEATRRLESPQARFYIRGNEGLARLFLGDLDGAEIAFADGLAACPDAHCEGVVDEALLGLAAVWAERGFAGRCCDAGWCGPAPRRPTTQCRRGKRASTTPPPALAARAPPLRGGGLGCGGRPGIWALDRRGVGLGALNATATGAPIPGARIGEA